MSGEGVSELLAAAAEVEHDEVVALRVLARADEKRIKAISDLWSETKARGELAERELVEARGLLGRVLEWHDGNRDAVLLGEIRGFLVRHTPVAQAPAEKP